MLGLAAALLLLGAGEPPQPSDPATLDAQADRAVAEKRWGDALPFARQAVEARRKAGGVPLALALVRLGGIHGWMGSYAEGVATTREAVSAAGAGSAETLGLAQTQLGHLHEALGHGTEAVVAWEAAAEAWRQVVPLHHPAVLDARTHAGRLLSGLGEHGRAAEHYRATIEAMEAEFGPSHPPLGEALNNLGYQLLQLAQYDAARPLFQRVLTLDAQRAGARSEIVAIGLNNLAQLEKRAARYEEARKLYEQSLALMVELHGEAHEYTATLRDNLGTLLATLGDFDGAAAQLLRAEETWRAVAGATSQPMAVNLNNQAELRKLMGDAPIAAGLLARSLAILEALHGATHPEVAIVLDNLAATYTDLDRPQEARPLFERALEIHIAALGPEHPEVAISHNNLASALVATGALTEAFDHYQRALAIQEKRLGNRHPDVGVTLSNSSGLLLRAGRAKEALALAERGLEVVEASLGAHHPRTGLALRDVAQAAWRLGDKKRARALAERSRELFERHMAPFLWTTSERERLQLIALRRPAMDLELALFDAPGDARRTYDLLLRWKAAVLASLTDQRARLRKITDPAVAQQLDELHRTREKLAGLTYRTPDPGTTEATAREIEALTTLKNRLERDLSRASREFQRASVVVSFSGVCAALAQDAALIDYVRYARRAHEPPSWVFAAFVVRGGHCEAPVRVELGEARAIEAAVETYRSAIASQAETPALDTAGARVRDLVWSPLEAHLAGATRVWVVPDGALHGMPLGVLPVGTDPDRGATYLVERVTLGTLASALSLAVPREAAAVRVPALVVGGAEYGPVAPEAARAGAPRAGCEALRHPQFSFLPGTQSEAAAVAKLLAPTHTVTVVGKDLATEARIKELLPQSRTAHLATHGFFAKGCRSALADKGGLNPLLLSGVVLAGANLAASRRGDANDGILTAEEVAGLDLRATELVVLSACETGLGDVRGGQGVLGLRWAFDLAGAGTLVMSLWEVPDEETGLLMRAFYGALARAPGARVDAFRAAQLSLLRRLREAGDPSPWAWGAFIVSGRGEK